jgi:hypothetical protein
MTIPFPTSFLTCLWIHIKHTWGLVQKLSVVAWLSICLVIPCFLLLLDVFSSMLWTNYWFNTLHLWPTNRPHGNPPPPSSPWWGKNYIPWCCTRCFCLHCKRCKVSSFVGTNSCSSIAFSLVSHWWVNIVFLVDGIHTLVDVIIVDPTWANLVSWVAFSRGVVVIVAVHVKEGLYYNSYPMDMFFFLAIEIFGCFQQWSDNFLRWCANMVWIGKGTESFLLSVLRSFYRQRMSMALSRTQATSISRWVVTTGEGSSRLGVLSGLTPLSLVDMLQATNGGFNA